MRLTREQFIEYVNAQIADKPFVWHPIECHCDFDRCQGWRVGYGPESGREVIPGIRVGGVADAAE